MQPQKLCFIASYPRSGNTWVRVFLFRLMQETGAIDRAEPLTRLATLLPWDIAARLVEWLLKKPLAYATELEMARVRPHVHRMLAHSVPVTPVVVKTHAFFGTLEGTPTIDPATYGSAVYLVRNPLDILPSLAKHLGKTLDDTCQLMGMRQATLPRTKDRAPEPWYDWSSNVRSWTELGPPSSLVVKYEDLKASPKHMLDRIARRFGMNPSHAQLDRALEATALERLQDAEATGEFRSPTTRSVFFGGGTDTPYRDKIGPAHARQLILAHARLMRVHGYLDEAALQFAGITAEEAQAAVAPAA